MRKYVFLILLILTGASLFAGEIFPVPQLPFMPEFTSCCRTMGEIVIDGKLDDQSWQYTPMTKYFRDIEGSLKPEPYKQTWVRMLWNDKGLYIAAEMLEDHIWATLTYRDAVIFRDNDFEVFIDPDGDSHDYYELEINALGTLWDLFLIKPYRDRQQVAVNSWDVRDIEYAVYIDGTLNDPSDKDTKWIVEMYLPWKVLEECAHMSCPPEVGDYWRMNFSRVQWQTDIIDGKYVKKEGVPESNWVWSPQGLIAMHYPERWGFVYFDEPMYERSDVVFNFPQVELAKEYLRQLYYKQKQYWFDHNEYAKTLEELGADSFNYRNKEYLPVIETTSQSYIITLTGTEFFPRVHIREDGLTW